MDNHPSEAKDWMNYCLEHRDELPDNDDDWQALKGALLDILPPEPVDLFAELGLSSENALFDETSKMLNSRPTSNGNSLGDLNHRSLEHVDSLTDGDVENHEIHNSYDTNGSKASTTYRHSNSIDSDEETDEEKEEELLKFSRENREMRLKFRGKEYVLVNLIEDEDKPSDEKAAVLPEDIEFFENIFRFWDLETPDEEDELTKQLRKALGKSISDELYDQGSRSPAVEDKELDEIVVGLEDLSLQPPSI